MISPLRAGAAIVLVVTGCVAYTSTSAQQTPPTSSDVSGATTRTAASPRPVQTVQISGTRSAPTGTAVPTSMASHAVPAHWRTERDGVVVRYPRTWVVTRYTGGPATVVFPLFYLSEYHLPAGCSGGNGPRTDAKGGTDCFNGTFRVPSDGLIVDWRQIEFPGNGDYRRQPGHPTRIDRHVAKLYSGPPLSCGPGASTEISAAIELSNKPADLRFSSDYDSVTICLGPHVPSSERAAVYTMIATMRIVN